MEISRDDGTGNPLEQLRKSPAVSLAQLPKEASAFEIYAAVENSYPEIAYLLNLSAQISENWTVGEHTLLALSVSERYPFLTTIQQGFEDGRWPLSAQSFVKAFTIHDAGKYIPELDKDLVEAIRAARKSGDKQQSGLLRTKYKQRQHDRVVHDLLPRYGEAMGLDSSEQAVMSALISDDEIGSLMVRAVNGRPDFEQIRGMWEKMETNTMTVEYYHQVVDSWEQHWIDNVIPEKELELASEATASLSQKAQMLGIEARDMLQLKIMYAQIDMAAYTGTAMIHSSGVVGKPVMDHYYLREPGKIASFSWADDMGRLAFSRECERKIALIDIR